MGKIDDEYDAAKAQYPLAPKNIPGELAIRIGGVVVPILGIVNSVRDYYSERAVTERLEALVEAVNSKTNATSMKIESPHFAESIRLAIEETWRTTDTAKVARFGSILGNAIVASDDVDSPRDAVEFIRAIAQLTDRDIRVLNILYSVNADIMKTHPNLHDPNPFTERLGDVFKAVSEANIHRDDFYSSCKRLEGFGLAIELARNPGRMAPGDYAFRPTLRGVKLLLLLR